jgi:hypothetical protein
LLSLIFHIEYFSLLTAAQSTLIERGMVIKQRVSFQWADKNNAAMEVTNETLKLFCNLLLRYFILLTL